MSKRARSVGARPRPSARGWGEWLLLLLSLTAWCPAQGLRWEPGEGHRRAKLEVPATGHAGFTLLPPSATGVWFSNQLSYLRSETNQNLLNGAGVAAGDFDHDGRCDFYLCNVEGANALYRNLGGWKFEEVAAQAGAACAHQCSRGAAFADVDGDGNLDLLVSSTGGPNCLLLNDGRGHFTDVTAARGLVLKAGSQGLTLADIDGDGDLDLFQANYGENTILRGGGMISVRTVGGKPVVTGRHARRLRIVAGQLIELGEPDVLYLNDGKGFFSPVSWTEGAFVDLEGKPLKSAPWDMGLSAMFRDLNQDGSPDLYVCNDFQTPDRIWINDGQGHFRPIAELALRSTPHFSMGVDFADFDRDGYDDIFVTDMLSRSHVLRMRQIGATNPPPEQVGERLDRHQIRRNVLFLNRGDGTYAEIANFAGVDATDWTWCMIFLDVDLDGYEDILVTNGHAYDTQDLDMIEKVPAAAVPVAGMRRRGNKSLSEYPPLRTPNVAFHNRGNRTFEEVGARWGFDATQVSHGMCLADLDNDGDLDIIVNCLWEPALVYRNDSPAPRVAVRLKGKAPNTQGIGATIKLFGGAVPVQSQQIVCGGRYLSADDPMRTFAAGSLTNRMSIEVTWRNGLRSLITNVLANYEYEVDEAGARNLPALTTTPTAPPAQPLFQDVSERLAHQHKDAPFDDLERQPLLPKKLSQLGPGVAWLDVDGDGHDDLVIGAGKGSALAVFLNDGKGNFRPWTSPAWSAPAPDDLTGLIGWSAAAGGRSLLVGVANYESPPQTPAQVLRYDLPARAGAAPALNQAAGLKIAPASIGPVCAADLDGDGFLDVFVGGRVLPGRYPEAAASFLYRNQAGSLELDAGNNRLFEHVGLVSGALFSDLDGDGFPELILACEWGPVKIFRNRRGQLAPWDAPVLLNSPPPMRHGRGLTLNSLTGWWSAVAVGDFDGDGQLDVLAANWGLNSSYYQPTADQPLWLYYGDFDGNSSIDLLEALVDPASGKIVPRRDLAFMATGLPTLQTQFPSHALYSLADVPAILGPQLAQAKSVRANTLASLLLLNRGDHFEAAPLPDEAQWSPAFGLGVADFDGDGREDVFLSQNFFAMRLEEPRLDSGRGLCLRGNGQGGFRALPGQESGIKVYGEQRGCAVSDFDEDGRPDLVVCQNDGATRLFRNTSAKPGLRVRLAGPPGNPDGIGAVIRLKWGERFGPARELHAGSGYWSEDSAAQVMALPQPPSQIWVRWPGGQATTANVPPGAREIMVDTQGKVTMVR